MARLLKEHPTDRFPNHGLISFALREIYPVSPAFAARVEKLHNFVKANLGRADLVEFVGSRFVVPIYCPSASIRFHFGVLKNPGDMLLSEGTVRSALAVLPESMIGICEVCEESFIKKCWCHTYCCSEHRRVARNRRRREARQRRKKG